MPKVPAVPKRILVVEDEIILADAYHLVLTKEGFEVKTAYDGQAALDVVKSFKPDLILLDLLMPRKDGIGFLKDYDALKKHPNVKIIVFSNLDMQKETQEAYRLGAHKYLLKAWATPATLSAIIRDTLDE